MWVSPLLSPLFLVSNQHLRVADHNFNMVTLRVDGHVACVGDETGMSIEGSQGSETVSPTTINMPAVVSAW